MTDVDEYGCCDFCYAAGMMRAVRLVDYPQEELKACARCYAELAADAELVEARP